MGGCSVRAMARDTRHHRSTGWGLQEQAWAARLLRADRGRSAAQHCRRAYDGPRTDAPTHAVPFFPFFCFFFFASPPDVDFDLAFFFFFGFGGARIDPRHFADPQRQA